LDDLVFVRSLGSSLGIHLGEGLGNSQFTEATFQSLSGSFTGTWEQFAANVDGDGDTDIVLNRLNSSNTVHVLRSNGDRSWTQASSSSNAVASWNNFTARVGDLDGLGSKAMIWADTVSENNDIVVGRWNGATMIYEPKQSAGYITPGDPPLTLSVGDVDGDGDVDLIWNTSGAANRTYVSLGQGDGSFDFSPMSQLHPDTGASWPQYTIYVADFNGDGRDDIMWNWAAATNRIYAAIGKS